MQVRNRFARVRPIVEHHPIAALFEAGFRSNLGRFQQKVSKQLAVARRGLSQAWDRFFRHEQNMRWRLWVDVAKSQHQIVFIDDVSRDFPRGDFFKQGSAHPEEV